MIAFVLASIFASHVMNGPAPAAQLAAVQRAVTFRVLLLSSSAQLLRAEAVRESATATGVRLEYSIEGSIVDVEEHVPDAGDVPPSATEQTQVFNLDGFPAVYTEAGNGFQHVSAVTWYRSDLSVRVSSRDRVSAPMLIDVALELR